MKIALSLLAALTLMTGAAHAQSSPSTSRTTLDTQHPLHFRFTVPSETNIREYRITAGDTNEALAEVARIKSAGFSAGPRTYKTTLAGTYRFYRVQAVGMDGAAAITGTSERRGTVSPTAPEAAIAGEPKR